MDKFLNIVTETTSSGQIDEMKLKPNGHILADSSLIPHWNSTSKVGRYFSDYERQNFEKMSSIPRW